MPHVCMLVDHHPFLDARIFQKEAKSLRKHGYKVTIVAPRKNGFLFDIDGTLFTDRFLEREFIYEGIKIVTYDPEEGKKESFKKKYERIKRKKDRSFSDPLFKAGLKQKADIYHAHEFLSLYSGVGIKRALKKQGKRTKLIFDSHELVVDPLRETRKKRQKLKISMLKRMLKETDYMLTVSRAIQKWHKKHLKISTPIEVIYNSPPLNRDYKAKEYPRKTLTLCYEGNIFDYKGNARKMFDIASIAQKSVPFRLKIIGGFRDGRKLVIPDHLKPVTSAVGWVPYETIGEQMRDVDLGWIDLDVATSLNRRYALPNKFFSYLNNGAPVLANQCSEVKKFIEKYECGIVIEKDDPSPEDYASTLIHLYRNPDILKRMSRNARQIMEQKYSWEHVEKKLLRVYKKVMSK